MLKYLAVLVEFVLGCAVEAAVALPGDPGDAVGDPADHDKVLGRLPYTHYIHPQRFEEDPSSKTQRPEYSPVILKALECVQGVGEDDVLSEKKQMNIIPTVSRLLTT
jgi:hypothetical protein